MGFRIRKSIRLGKGLRLNLGKSGVTSVTMGKRGAPHVTVGKGGTRFGTPIIPGTGISYETRLDKPSKKARRKNTTMGSQKEPAYTPSTFPTPTQQLPTTSEQPMEILAPTEVLQQPPATPTTPPRDGWNGGRNGRHGSHGAKKPWYKRWWGITIIVLLTIGVIGYIFTPSKAITALTDEGYDASDYKIESDSGKSVILYSNWEILSANNGVIRVHNKAADEEAARKAEEEKKKAEEEAAQKAEEERRKPPRNKPSNKRSRKLSNRPPPRKPHVRLNSRPNSSKHSSNNRPTPTIRTAPPQRQQVRHPSTEVSRAIRRSSIGTETE